MQRTAVHFAAVILAMLSLSCNETSTSPSIPQKLVLTASENPVTVALNYSKGITVSGGKGSCSVKSMTDTGIVQVTFYPYSGQPQSSQYVSLMGKKIGTAKIIVQDSARSAEVEITVTVEIMAASPSAVTVKVDRTKYVSFAGGTTPYALVQSSNASIAEVTFNVYSMDVRGVAQGTTSVIIRDNANPPNRLTVPIEVIPEPVFTTAGKISFTSTKGAFSANGIAVQDLSLVPPQGEGAGGWIYSSPFSGSLGEIIAYKMKGLNTIDLMVIMFVKTNLSSGTLPFSLNISRGDSAMAVFVLDGNLNSQTGDFYQLQSGLISFSVLNTAHATGTFQGNAVLTQNDIIFPGSTASVTDGVIDVPLLQEEIGGSTALSKQDEQVKQYVRKIIEREFGEIKTLHR